jgi:hypothetical protein
MVRGYATSLALRVTLLVLTTTTVVAAENWSGYLVDYDCFKAARVNVGPDTASVSSRDMDLDIRQCPPKGNTKSFALVPLDWSVHQFNPAANAKAADLFRIVAKQRVYVVKLVGRVESGLLKVDSILITK